MKKNRWVSNFFVFCFLLFPAIVSASDSTQKEKALQAIKAEDYQTAINICRREIESEPDNYEFNFILSRAYAYSRQYQRALDSLSRMLEIYPENLDF